MLASQRAEAEARKLAEGRERQAIAEKLAEARIALKQGRAAAYVREINQRCKSCRPAPLRRPRARLDQTDPSLRGWEWAYAMTLCRRRCRVLDAHHVPVDSVAFSPDGKRLVTVGRWEEIGERDQVIVWDTATARPIASWPSPGERFAFTPSGTSLVSLATHRQFDGTCIYSVRDVLSGKPVAEQKRTWALMARSPFSQDGERSVGVWDGGIRVAKAADGTDDVRLHGLKGPIISATFSPDRKFVAGVAWGHAPYQGKIPPLMPSLSGSSTQRTMCELKVWDLATAKPVFEHEGNVNWELVEFRADGRRLAATGYEIGTGLNSPELRIWDIVTAQGDPEHPRSGRSRDRDGLDRHGPARRHRLGL